MARRKYDFQPDRPQTDLLDKLYLTKKQRLGLLKWSLHALVVLVLSLIQDVILCHMDILGATTDLVPGAVFTLCVLLGSERGCIFTLVAAALFQFSGSAPGVYVIALIPFIAITLSALQQTLLRKGKGSDLLTAAIAVLIYEFAVFGISVGIGETSLFRVYSAAVTGVMTVICSIGLYFLFTAIEKIGGNPWNA